MTEQPWPCEAYGAEGLEYGVLCFVAPQRKRACASPEECHQVVADDRRRVYRLLHEGAAHGVAWMVDVAEEITRPDQIHSSDDTDDDHPGP